MDSKVNEEMMEQIFLLTNRIDKLGKKVEKLEKSNARKQRGRNSCEMKGINNLLEKKTRRIPS